MDVTDLTRQVQELTARVALLTHQRDDAREGRDSLQRECEGLREEVAKAQREIAHLRWLSEGNIGYGDRMERAFNAALEERDQARRALAAHQPREGHQRVSLSSSSPSWRAGVVDAALTEGPMVFGAVDAVGLPLAALRRAARVTVQIDFVPPPEEPA